MNISLFVYLVLNIIFFYDFDREEVKKTKSINKEQPIKTQSS